MQTKRIALSSLAVLALGAALVYAQEKKAAPASSPKDDPAMAKMMEFATPGAPHKVLEGKVGKWTAQVKTYMEPGKEPMTSTATCESKWVLDGRFVEDTFTGTVMEMPFHGRGMTGYDNMKKKYVTSWVDTFSTAIMVTEGTFDAGSKTFNFTGQMPDCMAGKYVATRIVEKHADADHFTFQMFSPGPDGKEMLGMEIAYTRAK